MSDCEGLPVGKRQIYIYPAVLPTGSHSQIAKAHAEPLAFEGSRSRSRERRKSLKPLRSLVRCSESVWRAGRVAVPGFSPKAQGLGRRKGSGIQADEGLKGRYPQG